MMYNEYQYNIYQLIIKYKLNYNWYNISDFLLFKNGQNWSNILDFKALKDDNKWLFKYQDNQDELGKDILKNGTFTPVFYMVKNNIKYIVIGKHRIGSLILNYLKNPNINKKILCIEIPLNFNNNNNISELYWNNKKYLPITSKEIYSFLILTGDTLTNYLWDNNCIPFLPFNNEQLFEEWLNGPEPIIE